MVQTKWVDIGTGEKMDGSFAKCGRSKQKRVDEKKKKLSKMRAHCESKTDDKGQRAGAVKENKQ